MPHDGGVVRQRAKLVRFDPVFLDPLVGVRGVIEMHGARSTLDPVLAERVGTTQGVGFGCRAVHDKILEIQGEDLGLFFCCGGMSDSNACAETISMSMQSRKRSMTLKSLVPSWLAVIAF